MRDKDDGYKLIANFYFALTVLSTTGYGDFYPVTTPERLVVILIQLIGIVVFSTVMATFMDLVQEYNRKMGPNTKEDELSNWIKDLS